MVRIIKLLPWLLWNFVLIHIHWWISLFPDKACLYDVLRHCIRDSKNTKCDIIANTGTCIAYITDSGLLSFSIMCFLAQSIWTRHLLKKPILLKSRFTDRPAVTERLLDMVHLAFSVIRYHLYNEYRLILSCYLHYVWLQKN